MQQTMNTQQQSLSLVRRYAGYLGVALILTGLLGLVLGDRSLFGLLNIDLTKDIIHLVTGGLLAYVGFGQRDSSLARTAVGGLGVVYVLVGVIGFILPDLFGLLPHEYSTFDNLFHIALGLANIAVAWWLGREGRGEQR